MFQIRRKQNQSFICVDASQSFFVSRLNNYLATKKDLDGTTIGQKTFDLRQTKMSEHQMSKDFLLTFKILSSTYAAADVIKQILEYAEIKHSDWLLYVTWQVLNQLKCSAACSLKFVHDIGSSSHVSLDKYSINAN